MFVATGPTGNVGAEVAALLAKGAADAPYRLAAHSPEKHKYKEYTLTGPETLNFYEVAEIFSDVMERPIRYSNPSLFSFWRRLFRRGVPWDVLLFMTIVYTLTRRGKNELETEQLPDLLGRPPRTMRHFVKDYLQRWQNQDWT